MNSTSNKHWKLIATMMLILIVVSISIEMILKENNKSKAIFAAENSDNDIIPKPLSYKIGDGNFIITKDTSIYVKGNTKEETEEISKIAEFIRGKLKASTGFELNIIQGKEGKSGSIYLTTIGAEESQGNEGYEIVTTNKNVKIIAYKAEGISRGVQTLRQLLPPDIEKNTIATDVEWNIPVSIINDKPEYNYRGLMIDVVRHFFTIDEVKRQIDYAAQYKINRVHLHLSDDQGWRLEIKKYPDLTIIGGSTEVGGGKGGYYTQEEFKDLVKYAAERYVEIIPEFDMPGHSNAALASYGFLNKDGEKKPLYTGTEVGFSSLMTHNEETYEFIDNLIKEVSEISPSKYIHIGGDEADSTKKSDYDYFVGRVSKIIEKYGKTPIGWDPIDISPEINSSVILQNWKDSNEAARKKEMKMIISIAQKAYLDMKYNESTPYGLTWAGYIPVETAYKWDPTDYAPKELVLGIEAPLWTETISDTKAMDYMIYPRLLGYAEIGWTPKENRDWSQYKNRLEKQGKRMKNQGINYYKDSRIWGESNTQ
ncbi:MULTISPECIES: family 20 glycosylhydrolase [unclassified Clostridium]|uniref:family 20 glycosylhydrolase n=1 Tax=unclassified Clostridium TaxID=2614128 RepID=UPI0013F91077|nr:MULTISPECIES: family 20 glycosylhydrolase [unclassified Clostridium]MBN1038334.1 beta-N-acetylhexosaminidase [Clostridium botulinum]MBN1055029.1 beta-N-acetylhexosaminidase [Clostridium botulinum]NFR85559.1 beta-N-acetylhexosaminidase [Clostridium botulinum]NFR88844.1 beta-N-acetylhexosaminidase [Clostridium botulinum]NFT98330.1 beta-N-acetylhexosaminidase [Clostridium botulinum]